MSDTKVLEMFGKVLLEVESIEQWQTKHADRFYGNVHTGIAGHQLDDVNKAFMAAIREDKTDPYYGKEFDLLIPLAGRVMFMLLQVAEVAEVADGTDS